MLSIRSSSNRKPLSDLTNKLSATSISSLDDRESTSSKVSVIKAQIPEDSIKKNLDLVYEEYVTVPVEALKPPDVSVSQPNLEVEKEGGAKPKMKSRPANLTNLGVSSLENFPQ